MMLNRESIKNSRILYWRGCVSRYRLNHVIEATINVFEKLGINYTLLGDREGCCGDFLLLLGLIDEAKRCAVEVVSEIINSKVDIVVTNCAGCYRAFSREYPERLGIEMPFAVMHLSQLLNVLMKDNSMEFNPIRMKVTYHDPCELGRRCGIYEEPRSVLKAIPGVRLVESKYARESCRCCGAGGGVFALYPNLSIEVAKDKLEKEVLPLEVDALVTCCPVCYINLSYAATMHDLPLEVYDIAEVVAMALK